MPIHFEDLEVGSTFEPGSYTVGRDEIVEFAERYDPQPFHLDERAAEESMFGGLVASGLHTLCLSVRLFVTRFINPGNGLANMGGLGLDDLRWHRPVRPNETLSLRVEVLEKRPSRSRPDRGYVHFDRRMLDGDGEAVMSFVSINVVRRRDVDD